MVDKNESKNTNDSTLVLHITNQKNCAVSAIVYRIIVKIKVFKWGTNTLSRLPVLASKKAILSLRGTLTFILRNTNIFIYCTKPHLECRNKTIKDNNTIIHYGCQSTWSYHSSHSLHLSLNYFNFWCTISIVWKIY